MKTLKPLTIAIVTAILLCVAAVALYLFSAKPASLPGAITDPDRIATYDAEFVDYVGSDHRITEYCYVDSQISQQLDFGYGPLCDVAGYQVIVGQTGTVGVVAYGSYSRGKWDMYPGRDCDWSTIFILVFDGCVAPQEWWNRPVTASMFYDIPTTDGGYLPELMIWIPWPEWFDFDNPPIDATIQAKPWYWDGSQYVKANFVNDQLDFPSQVITSDPL